MSKKEEMTVRLLHYEVRGMALIRDWYDHEGSVEMKPYTVKSWSDAGEGINDGGFGAQEILGAKLHVYAVYGPETPVMFPGYSPLKLPTDTFYISLTGAPKLTDKEKKFLDQTDTSIPVHPFVVYADVNVKDVDKEMKEL